MLRIECNVSEFNEIKSNFKYIPNLSPDIH